MRFLQCFCLPVRGSYLFLFIINIVIYYSAEILHDLPALFIPRLIRDSPDNGLVTRDIAVLELRMGVDEEVVAMDTPEHPLAGLYRVHHHNAGAAEAARSHPDS